MGKKKNLWHYPQHHPVMRLLEETFELLKPLFVAAAQQDVSLVNYRGEGGDLLWWAYRKPREVRKFHVFARLMCEGGLVQSNVRMGVVLTIQDPQNRSQEFMSILITRCLHGAEKVWTLEIERYVPRRRLPPDIQRLLRRLNMRGLHKRRLHHGEEERVTLKLAKNFKETVIIPRQMREKARK